MNVASLCLPCARPSLIAQNASRGARTLPSCAQATLLADEKTAVHTCLLAWGLSTSANVPVLEGIDAPKGPLAGSIATFLALGELARQGKISDDIAFSILSSMLILISAGELVKVSWAFDVSACCVFLCSVLPVLRPNLPARTHTHARTVNCALTAPGGARLVRRQAMHASRQVPIRELLVDQDQHRSLPRRGKADRKPRPRPRRLGWLQRDQLRHGESEAGAEFFCVRNSPPLILPLPLQTVTRSKEIGVNKGGLFVWTALQTAVAVMAFKNEQSE